MKLLTYISINIRFALVFGIVLLTMQKGRAQDTMELTLNDAISLALKNNWQIRKAEQKVGIASAELRQAKAAFLPTVNLSETFITTTDPLMNFGIKLKQEVTTVQDFNPELLNDPSRIVNYATVLKIEQPIFNPGEIHAKKAAAKNVAATEHAIIWTKSLTSIGVKTQYFNLQLGHKRKQAVLNALKAGQANQVVAGDLYDQNLINQADLLAAKLRVTELESEVLSADNYLYNLNNSLTHSLGLDQEVTLIPIDSLPAINDVKNEIQLATISENRTDIVAFRLQMEARDMMLKSSKRSLLPRFNAFGSYELNDNSAFGNGASNYMVGAKLEWDVFKGGTKYAKIRKASHQKKLSEIMYQEKVSESSRALRRAQNDLKLASKQLELSELAYEQAAVVYQVRKDRFAQGMEKTSDLLQAETELLSKKLESLQRINNYQQLVFQIEMLLERDLTNRI